MHDLKFAVRQLLKNPGFTAVAVFTLALGIGACTTIFSALDAVLFRPLPYPAANRLVQLYETLPEGDLNSASGGAFLDWREHQTTFDEVALINPVTRNLQGGGAPERLDGLEATHEFLSVLGIQPILGRGFTPGEDQPGGDNKVVMITEEAWRSRFGAQSSIVGQSLRLDEVTHTIIGVLPNGAFPRGIWSPFESQFVVPAVASRTATGKYSRSEHWALVYARLKSGVSVEQADIELNRLKQKLNPEYPGYKQDWGAAVQPLHDRVSGPQRATTLMLMGAVAIVFLIGCANVASLMLVRALSRQQEIAVRAALGATAGRIVRQVLTESLLLSLIGGLAGTALSVWGIQLLGRLTGEFLPGGMTPRLDIRVLAFSFVLAGLTGFLFGIFPAWQARRPDLNEALKNGGKNSTTGGRHRTQSALVIAEVALTVMLLAAGGLLLKSLSNAMNADPGFEPERTLAFDLSLPESTYPDDAARFRFTQQALEHIRSLPGVESAGTGMGIPFSGGSYGERVGRSGQPQTESNPIASINYVSAGYLEALGVRFLSGRGLLDSDDHTNALRSIVINETVVRKFFPDSDPIGRTLSMLGNDWRIVGVVATLPNQRIDEEPELCLYVPHVFNSARFSIVVRTKLDPLSLVSGIRREIQNLDAGLPLANIRSLDRSLAGSMHSRQIVLILIMSFGGAAVLLACLGLYGVMAYSVTIRRREMSIRLALGAARWNVSGLIVREASALICLGLLVGLGGAFATNRLLASQLFKVGSNDPVVMTGTLIIVLVVALLASWLPARRAAKVDPMAALRTE